MSNQIEVATKAFSEISNQMRDAMEQTFGAIQSQVEQASVQIIKGFDDALALNAKSVDAVRQSAEIVIGGSDEATKLVTSFARASLEQSFAVSKALFSVRTPAELFAVHQTYVKSYLEALRSQAEQLSSLSVKVSNEAIAPLSATVTENVQLVSRKLAA